MPAVASNVKVKCPGCKAQVALSADAVRELGSRLSVQVKCPSCGRERSVSALRSTQQAGATPGKQPAKAAAPFRPLFAPAAETEPKSSPRTATTPQPAPLPDPIEAPFAALGTAPMAVPFAPLESPQGQELPPKAGKPKPSLAEWWRELPVARRQLLAVVVMLAIGSVALGTVMKLKRMVAPAATETQPTEQTAPLSAAPVEVPSAPQEEPKEPAREVPPKKETTPPPDARPNPFRPEGP